MSDDLDTIDQAITDAATTPASASVDGTAATSRSVDDLIKLRNHVAAREAAAANRKGFGIRTQRIVPQGGG